MTSGVLTAVHANCFLPPGVTGDLLLTDEPAVAEAAAAELRIPARTAEPNVDPATAHALSRALWQLAHSWFCHGDADPTVIDGVSVGKLAACEAALTMLLPAARAILAMASALAEAPTPARLISVAPGGTPGGDRYDELEQLAAEAALAAARELLGDELDIQRRTSTEPRNARLRDKYLRTRDPDPLLTQTRSRVVRGLLLQAANVISTGRGRRPRTLLVVDYNPTLAFSRAYLLEPHRQMRLVRWVASPGDVLPTVRGGDLVDAPPLARAKPPGGLRFDGLAGDPARLDGADFEVAGVPLWPLIGTRLAQLLDRYGDFAVLRAARLRRRLTRLAVDAVLVPFDSAPPVRLLVAVARSLDIPTFVLNDGYKADDIQLEGFTTDVALASSRSVAENYFVRHPGRVELVGNPRMEYLPAGAWRRAPSGPLRVLVGSFTFSPVDLNCRRGDAEQFLAEVLAGIELALPAVRAEVVLKLHPADEPAHYQDLLARFPRLHIELRTEGYVEALFAQSDVYLTTYSGSLLEAARTMPVIYYRVNHQELGPPFERDAYLDARTASSPADLAALLNDRTVLGEAPPAGWLERYLGSVGAVERVRQAIESELRSRSLTV